MQIFVGIPAATLIFGLCIMPSTSWGQKATVVSLRNKAEACSPVKPCRSLDFGLEVLDGDSLKTFKQSRLVVRFPSGSLAELGPNSLLVLAEIQANGKKTIARWGEFDFSVKKADSKGRFQVRTPVAVAGAEGTEFKVTIDPSNGATKIDLLEGELKIAPVDPKLPAFRITAGQSLEMQTGAPQRITANAAAATVPMNPQTTPESSPTPAPVPLEVPTPEASKVSPAVQAIDASRTKGTIRLHIEEAP